MWFCPELRFCLLMVLYGCVVFTKWWVRLVCVARSFCRIMCGGGFCGFVDVLGG